LNPSSIFFFTRHGLREGKDSSVTNKFWHSFLIHAMLVFSSPSCEWSGTIVGTVVNVSKKFVQMSGIEFMKNVIFSDFFQEVK